MKPTLLAAAALLAATAALAPAASAADAPPSLNWSACRLPGLAQAARCAVLRRPLDPARPQGPQIDLHIALLPAVARAKAADPVVFLAGGPGQSAIDLAATLVARHGRLQQRRDLVLVDQRGTGRSAPLLCPDDRPRAALMPLAEAMAIDEDQRRQRLAACRSALQAQPHGDLRFYTTLLATVDLEAVRLALGAEQLNLIGASYGTRAGLDYLRQHPQRVRRAVLDGLAPPDMRLHDTAARDNQAALDAVLAACAADSQVVAGLPGCAQRHPDLARRLQALRQRLPIATQLPHPISGRPERVMLQADQLSAWLRAPLYAPALAAGLPAAIDAAAQPPGREDFAPLLALASSLMGPGSPPLATGMHLSVLCAEDLGPNAPPADAADRGAQADAANAFGGSFSRLYQQACADWPRGTVPADFYRLPAATAPVWLLSGSDDPVTPPRHGERVAQALGSRSRHLVVQGAGHGLLALGCVRDAAQRFITAADDTAALAATEAQGLNSCVARHQRATAYRPIGTAPPAAAAASTASNASAESRR
ncbi:MAG: alpha/beta fold hydrolase [Burkholderiaceae bacterium]|nr:alpha/beta fold hydrolase [Burkholderiaceae bacterium]